MTNIKRVKLLACLVFIAWVVTLTAVLIDEGAIQIGGSDFRLQANDD